MLARWPMTVSTFVPSLASCIAWEERMLNVACKKLVSVRATFFFFFVCVACKHSCLSMSMTLFATVSLCLSTCLSQFHVNLVFNVSSNAWCTSVIV